MKKQMIAPNTDQQGLPLHNLLESTKAMGELRDLDELLDFLAHQSVQALKADRCSIFLLDCDKDEIWSKVSLGEKVIRFPRHLGIAGETIQSGKAIKLDDAYQDPRFNHAIDRQTGYRTRTLLSVPMRNAKGLVIGCFEAINKKDGFFSEDDQDYLQAFANQAAVAIEMALLYQTQDRMIQALEQANQDLEVKMRELEFVYKLEQASAQASSLESYLTTGMNFLADLMQVDAVVLYFMENKQIDFYTRINEQSTYRRYNLHQLAHHPQLVNRGFRLIPSDFKDGLQKKVLESLMNQTFQHENAISFQFDSARFVERCFGHLVLFHSQENFEIRYHSILQILSKQLSGSMTRFKLAEERERAQRFATIGHLASTIIHDFRNPLTGIRGFAELIQLSYYQMEPKEIEKTSEMIIKQVDLCSSMIDELLQFARGNKNYHFERCQLTDLFRDLEEILRIEAERRRINLIIKNGYDGDMVLDRDKLIRALLNLSNNALAMLKSGDSIEISSIVRTDDWIEIRVTDNGPGVSPSIRSSLFDPFVTEGKEKGTGLGLHITKEIIESHGGFISLDETFENGASFVLVFDPKFEAKIDDHKECG